MRKAMSLDVNVKLIDFLALDDNGNNVLITLVGEEDLICSEVKKSDLVCSPDLFGKYRSRFVKSYRISCASGLIELCIELK